MGFSISMLVYPRLPVTDHGFWSWFPHGVFHFQTAPPGVWPMQRAAEGRWTKGFGQRDHAGGHGRHLCSGPSFGEVTWEKYVSKIREITKKRQVWKSEGTVKIVIHIYIYICIYIYVYGKNNGNWKGKHLLEVKGTCGKTCKLYMRKIKEYQRDGKRMNTYIAKKENLENIQGRHIYGKTGKWSNGTHLCIHIQWYTYTLW